MPSAEMALSNRTGTCYHLSRNQSTGESGYLHGGHYRYRARDPETRKGEIMWHLQKNKLPTVFNVVLMEESVQLMSLTCIRQVDIRPLKRIWKTIRILSDTIDVGCVDGAYALQVDATCVLSKAWHWLSVPESMGGIDLTFTAIAALL